MLISDQIHGQFESEADSETESYAQEIYSKLHGTILSTEISEALDRLKSRDMMLATLFTGFLPENEFGSGAIARNTGWEIKGAALELPNTDDTLDIALLDGRRSAAIIVCLTIDTLAERRLSALSTVFEACRDDSESLERRLSGAGRPSIDNDNIYPVICVNEDILEKYFSKIEDRVQDSQRVNPWTWEISLSDNQSIALVNNDRLPTPTRELPNGSLVELLSSGVNISIDSEVTPDIYPTSTKLVEAAQVAKHIVENRVDDDDDNSLSYFRESTVVAFYEDTDALVENTNGQLGEEQARDMIQWWEEQGIIESVPPSDSPFIRSGQCYQFNTRARNPGKIMRQIEDMTRAEIVDEQITRHSKMYALSRT